MRASRNCSEKISKEHYISAKILSEFPNLRTSGLPWHGPGETRVSANDLQSNILCTRHNSAFSSLDTEGWRVLIALREAIKHVARKSLSRRTLFRIVSGEAFELWALKTLMGLLEAKVARTDGEATKTSYVIDEAMVTRALSGGGFPPGYGLYIGNDSDLLHDEIGFAPLTHGEEGRVAGLRISFLGVVIDLLLDPRAADAIVAQESLRYRPAIVDLIGSKRTARIIFTRPELRREGSRLALNVDWVPHTAPEAAGLKARRTRKEFYRRPRPRR